MNTQPIKTLSVFCFFVIDFLLACNKQKKNVTNGQTTVTTSYKNYIPLIISFDTSSSADFKKKILEQDSLLSRQANKEQNPFYHYFRGAKYALENKRDSAKLSREKMKGEKPYDDIELLKECRLIEALLSNGSMVEPILMERIFSDIEHAEQSKSHLLYLFYDLLARAYYQNQDDEKSLKYASMHFDNHPFKTHTKIRQRYFDISFLLASHLNDFKKMEYYNSQARALAEKIGDSLAIVRTYNNEAEIYSAKKLYDKALVASKIYFNFLKLHNNLNANACNNLGTAFIRDRQPDSAIYYYKEAIELERKDPSGKQNESYYFGLKDSYMMKGDYVKALELSDSGHAIAFKNIKSIEAVKVAELHEKYETEKKDQNIQQLKSRNQLNEAVIKQQRWTIFLSFVVFLGALLFFYFVYRQQHLREKNNLLKSENQRLNLEQKVLQGQLNPHFIYNAIANLQGLVASGHAIESVRYLKSFSSLLRGILEQNRKDFIEIEEEIASLHNYIQLQQMRYDGVFDYKITVDDQLDVHQILIPPMLIQPFVENTIEHGFRNIAYKGLLTISFNLIDNSLIIVIDDNGSGLVSKANDKQKKQSLAQIILKERFDLLFTSRGQKAQFNLIDKKNSQENGVRVEIILPIINA